MHKVKEALHHHHRETKVVADPNVAPTPVAVEGVEPVAVPVPGVLPTPVVMPNLMGGTTTPVYVPVDSLPQGTVLNRAPEFGGNVVVGNNAATAPVNPTATGTTGTIPVDTSNATTTPGKTTARTAPLATGTVPLPGTTPVGGSNVTGTNKAVVVEKDSRKHKHKHKHAHKHKHGHKDRDVIDAAAATMAAPSVAVPGMGAIGCQPVPGVPISQAAIPNTAAPAVGTVVPSTNPVAATTRGISPNTMSTGVPATTPAGNVVSTAPMVAPGAVPPVEAVKPVTREIPAKTVFAPVPAKETKVIPAPVKETKVVTNTKTPMDTTTRRGISAKTKGNTKTVCKRENCKDGDCNIHLTNATTGDMPAISHIGDKVPGVTDHRNNQQNV